MDCTDASGGHDAHSTERPFADAEAQDLFETAFSHAPIGMALIAPDGRWLKVNRALCVITGWPESELIRASFQEITHPDDAGADQELIARLLAGEIPGYQFEKRYIRRGGTEIWAEAVGIGGARRHRHSAPLHRAGGGHHRAQGGPAPPPGG